MPYPNLDMFYVGSKTNPILFKDKVPNRLADLLQL
jgi:hypothetical protein